MTSLYSFVADNAFEGQQGKVKTRKGGVWIPVGNGEIVSLSESRVQVTADVDIFGFDDQFDIDIELLDDEDTIGTCSLRINHLLDDEAIYHVRSKELLIEAQFKGHHQDVLLSKCNKGQQTQCKLKGKIKGLIHLEPKKKGKK